jgi:hypothetical protein
MGRGTVPADEVERIAAVRRYDILDTPPDAALDRIAALAAALFDVPLAVVSIVDTDRVCFTARHGLDLRQVDRGTSLCAAAILGDGPHVIPDTTMDPFARGNPLVGGEFGLRFYAGVPLVTHDRFKLGMLCVMDTCPRPVTDHEIRVLTHLATLVVQEMEVRRSVRPRTSDVNTEHADVSALLGVHVVGACDPATAATVQRHLAVCVECTAEDRRLRAAAAWIGGVDAVEPPPGLRGRIAGQLGRDEDES